MVDFIVLAGFNVHRFFDDFASSCVAGGNVFVLAIFSAQKENAFFLDAPRIRQNSR